MDNLNTPLPRNICVLPATLLMLTSLAQTPFIPKDQFDETPSSAWTYLPNAGQVFDIGSNFRDDVKFHSVGTYPTIYSMKHNRIAICVPEPDLPTHQNDVIFGWTLPSLVPTH